MKVSIWFSWPAWSWVNTSGMFLWQLLSAKWYNILADKEYASIIKGDNNNFFLYISDQDEHRVSNQIDYFFAYDDLAISKNEKIYWLKNKFNIKTEQCKYKNTFAFWWALKIFWIDISQWEEMLKKTFKEESLETNLIDLKAGYEYIEKNCGDACSIINFSKKIWDAKKFMFGNEIIWEWAIASWMDFYSAYPMTPASSLIDVIAPKKEATFFQWEDEIAVSMAMLGAKFAWKRAACGTSGGWFALMTESIAFSHQAELWGLYILSQRDGPSTWTPTYTWQSDLNYALNASFWDTKPIILAPSTYEDGYNLIWKALNRSDIYQHPVIFLVDKQYSESYLSISEKNLKAEPINRGKLITEAPEWFKRYEFTQDGISPYSIPGVENWEFNATSYEHDEYWATNETVEIKEKMTLKKFKKLDTFVSQEFNETFYGYEIINPEASQFFITFGFTSYNLKEFIKLNPNHGIIVIKVLQPFDKRLKTRLHDNEKRIENLTFVEMNFTWQLEDLVKKECNLNSDKREKKIKNIRKYTLFPIFMEELN